MATAQGSQPTRHICSTSPHSPDPCRYSAGLGNKGLSRCSGLGQLQTPFTHDITSTCPFLSMPPHVRLSYPIFPFLSAQAEHGLMTSCAHARARCVQHIANNHSVHNCSAYTSCSIAVLPKGRSANMPLLPNSAVHVGLSQGQEAMRPLSATIPPHIAVHTAEEAPHSSIVCSE
jgi:hypothetical protein